MDNKNLNLYSSIITDSVFFGIDLLDCYFPVSLFLPIRLTQINQGSLSSGLNYSVDELSPIPVLWLINDVGLLQPLVFDQKNRVVSGNRRLDTIRALGI